MNKVQSLPSIVTMKMRLILLTFGREAVHHALNYVQFVLDGEVDEIGVH